GGIRWEASLTLGKVAAVVRVRERAAIRVSIVLWVLAVVVAVGAAAGLSRSAGPGPVMCLVSAAVLLACHRRIAEIVLTARAQRWFDRGVPPSATYGVSAEGASLTAEVRSVVVSCEHPWQGFRAWYEVDGALVLVPAGRRTHTVLLPLADPAAEVRQVVSAALPLDTRRQRIAGDGWLDGPS
ncbi:MAG: hypothetical protein QOI35_1155, partial [Cryptosporangiaceae bacterium]|nr:hypothetical protein [Cryptosporangiaceae bacterium]